MNFKISSRILKNVHNFNKYSRIKILKIKLKIQKRRKIKKNNNKNIKQTRTLNQGHTPLEAGSGLQGPP